MSIVFSSKKSFATYLILKNVTKFYKSILSKLIRRKRSSLSMEKKHTFILTEC